MNRDELHSYLGQILKLESELIQLKEMKKGLQHRVSTLCHKVKVASLRDQLI